MQEAWHSNVIDNYNNVCLFANLWCMYFSCAGQEKYQKKPAGGRRCCEVYRCCQNKPTLLPRLRATLPPDPAPGLIESFYVFVFFLYLTIRAAGSWCLAMYDLMKSYPSAKNRNIFC